MGTSEVFGRCGIFAAFTTLTAAQPHQITPKLPKIPIVFSSIFVANKLFDSRQQKTWHQIQSSADLRVSVFWKQAGLSWISGKPILSGKKGGWFVFEYFETGLKTKNQDSSTTIWNLVFFATFGHTIFCSGVEV